MKQVLALGLSAALFLSACGNEPDALGGAAMTKAMVTSTTSKLKKAEVATPQLTREMLKLVLTPVMLATIESRGQQAMIAEVQTNGPVATWSTQDDVTISMKGGVIVATRGLGNDLMAASVPAVVRQSAGSEGRVRVHSYLNGEDQTVRRQFACSTAALGQETIVIVEISYSATRIRETCTSDDASFQNDYWFTSDQKMRKSRQWISEDVGYLTIEDLRR